MACPTHFATPIPWSTAEGRNANALALASASVVPPSAYPDLRESLSEFLVRNILTGHVQRVEDFVRVGVLLPIPPGVRDETVHLVLKQPEERWRDRVSTILIVLQNGTTPLERDGLGDIALHILAGIPGPGSARFMSLLLGGEGAVVPEDIQSQYEKSIDSPNFHGNTALLIAVLYNHFDCVKVLLAAGANPEVKGETGKSPLRIAEERDYWGIVNILLRSATYPPSR
ncbi:hypothetical protein NKR23_g12560 [Pleurostoma richardsiae]|uniref:Ankyrin n=1 Tax=Pleurostoma richardsiae TaxID=41990 RepID=A0AA38R1A9_9PEZI|nr:hypothetical protein NKR23_g12560 [Pleurostoma richardsiae]